MTSRESRHSSNPDESRQTGLDPSTGSPPAPLPSGIDELLEEARAFSGKNRHDEATADAYWDRVHALHAHPDRAGVLATALELTRAKSARERELGVDICAQIPLAVEDDAERARLTEQILAALAPRLADKNKEVLSSAIHAAGHLGVETVLDDVLAHAAAPQPELRFAVACAIGGCAEPRAVEALIAFSEDVEADVRDWACFGLGTQLEGVDTPELRAALRARLEDPHPDVRGEAQLGLALRGEREVLPYVRAALEGYEVSTLSIEAARALPSRSLVEPLVALAESWPEPDAIDAAIEACENAPDA